MASRSDSQVSHIYGIKDGSIVHLYLDESRMQKRLINLRSDGSQIEYIVPLAKPPTVASAEVFGFMHSIEVRNPDSEQGMQLLAELLEKIEKWCVWNDLNDRNINKALRPSSDGNALRAIGGKYYAKRT